MLGPPNSDKKNSGNSSAYKFFIGLFGLMMLMVVVSALDRTPAGNSGGTDIPKPLAEDIGDDIFDQQQESVEGMAEEPETPPVTEETGADAEFWLVSRVVDGDTIEVTHGGDKEKVRLIGVNTPETVDPRKPVECFGREASAFAKQLQEGQTVRLVSDDSQDDRDIYGRLLRYVILEDGTNVNLELIKGGYGYEYTYAVPYIYQSEFKSAQDEAKATGVGLWAPGVCDQYEGAVKSAVVEMPVIPAVGVQEPTDINTGSPDCYCHSNRYNCKDFSTHAEAQTLYECCMSSVGYDIHQLDGNDDDGNACENRP